MAHKFDHIFIAIIDSMLLLIIIIVHTLDTHIEVGTSTQLSPSDCCRCHCTRLFRCRHLFSACHVTVSRRPSPPSVACSSRFKPSVIQTTTKQHAVQGHSHFGTCAQGQPAKIAYATNST